MISEQCFFTGGLWTPCASTSWAACQGHRFLSSISESSLCQRLLHASRICTLNNTQSRQSRSVTGKHRGATLKSLSQKPPETASFPSGLGVQAPVTLTIILALILKHGSCCFGSTLLKGWPLSLVSRKSIYKLFLCSQGSSLALKGNLTKTECKNSVLWTKKETMCMYVCVRERQTDRQLGWERRCLSEETGVGYVLSLGFPNNFPCIKSNGTHAPVGNYASPRLYKKTLRLHWGNKHSLSHVASCASQVEASRCPQRPL